MFTAFVAYTVSFVIVPVVMESLYLARIAVSSAAAIDANCKELTFEELYS